MSKFVLISASLLFLNTTFASTKCFLQTENHHVIQQEGDCKARHAPCSTFKIPISLMGYNEGILIDETHPTWQFKKGYADFIETWHQPHNPTTWIKDSCVWYSRLITQKMGIQKFKQYVAKFHYGNQDVSGDKGKNNGITNAWLSSSLQISPEEQIHFLENLVENKLPVSLHSQKMAKRLFFVELLPDGWKLYGKTGSGNLLKPDGSKNEDRQIGWFVGWMEKDARRIIVAQYIEDEDKQPTWAGKRAKEIAKEKLKAYIFNQPKSPWGIN